MDKTSAGDPINPVDTERLYENYLGKQLQPKIGIGLTKREHFAAMALQGLLANPSPEVLQCQISVATLAVSNADALIKELNRR